MRKIFDVGNSFYAFLVFVGVVVGIVVLCSGFGFWSAFFTGLVVYILLRFLYAVWGLFLKIVGALGVRYGKD